MMNFARHMAAIINIPIFRVKLNDASSNGRRSNKNEILIKETS